jgi:hypothetical protein
MLAAESIAGSSKRLWRRLEPTGRPLALDWRRAVAVMRPRERDALLLYALCDLDCEVVGEPAIKGKTASRSSKFDEPRLRAPAEGQREAGPEAASRRAASS